MADHKRGLTSGILDLASVFWCQALGEWTCYRLQVAHVDVLGVADSEPGVLYNTCLAADVIESATRAFDKFVSFLGVSSHTRWQVMGSLDDHYISLGVMTSERYHWVDGRGTRSLILWEIHYLAAVPGGCSNWAYMFVPDEICRFVLVDISRVHRRRRSKKQGSKREQRQGDDRNRQPAFSKSMLYTYLYF
jgi:hypothetical protein